VTGTSANEGAAIVFTISRSNLTTGTFSVSYATSNGSATAYSDYYPASGTLTLPESETHKTVTVTTVLDNVAEADETIVMTLSNPTGGSTVHSAGGQAMGTIKASAANHPPTAVTDNFSIARCTAGSFNVVANDSDPEGDSFAVTAVWGGAVQQGYASSAGPTSIAWAQVAIPGDYSLFYTVKDSRGASADGTVYVTVTGSGSTACP
jgi:hypothetical protein